MGDQIKVMLPAAEIPLGSRVTKRTGQKEYKLLDKLRVWPINSTASAKERAAADPDSKMQEITASPGVLFLVEDGNANAIPSNLELVWVTTINSLRHYLQHGRRDRLYGRD